MIKYSTFDSRQKSQLFHPCYSGKAHHYFARVHLAVAPRCNIQCNYCNRKYDCANESRPGVVSERLTPEEAFKKVQYVSNQMKELSVVGIAGPGDALANARQTFKTFHSIRKNFPDLILCFSTNGLAIRENIDKILEVGVKHITVTINTLVPETAARIYKWILLEGRKASGKDAMSYLLDKQIEGVKLLVSHGCLVKVNSVLIPGINEVEFPSISEKLKSIGVFLHNIMPLMNQKHYGTDFGRQGIPGPSHQLLERVREACGGMKQMAHCRHCRADAVGMLDNDLFMQYGKNNFKNIRLHNNGYVERQKWKTQVESFYEKQNGSASREKKIRGDFLIAACTKGSGIINQDFENVSEFQIYRVRDGNVRLINIRRVRMHCGRANPNNALLEDAVSTIKDCHGVVCRNIGHDHIKLLESMGIMPIVCTLEPLEKAVIKAAVKIAGTDSVPEPLRFLAVNR